MQIAILALGSRGDVQPFIALALALRHAGEQPVLIGLADYADLAAAYGLPYTSVVGAAAELMDRELVNAALESAGVRLTLRLARSFLEQVEPLVVQLCAECLRACAGSEMLIASSLGLYPGFWIAETLGLPLIPAHFHPYGATITQPDLSFPPLPPWVPLQRAYNLLSHHMAAHGLWQLLRRPLNRARREVFGLAPLSVPALWGLVSRFQPLTLYGYSPIVAPPPLDWPPHRCVTGYWTVAAPPGWTPPRQLSDFLAAGSPPVYVGFGSALAGRDPEAVTRMLVDAVRRSGRRGLIYRGAWGDLAPLPLPDDMLAIDATPHEWLFRRVAAVVTHSGAGTIAAALRAGAPVVSVPYFGDMRFWARRTLELGVGTVPIPRRELTVDRLAEAIEYAVGNRELRRRAGILAATLADEDGAAEAARVVRGIVAQATTKDSPFDEDTAGA